MLSWPELESGLVGNMGLLCKETVATLPLKYAFSNLSTNSVSPLI